MGLARSSPSKRRRWIKLCRPIKELKSWTPSPALVARTRWQHGLSPASPYLDNYTICRLGVWALYMLELHAAERSDLRQLTGMDKFPEFMKHPANRISTAA